MTGVFKAITIASLALAAPAFAGGDAEKGAKVFNKCKSCHMIQNDAGNNIVKGGKTGPNLYGISGRVAGSLDGFRYGKSLKSVADSGLAWSEEEFVSYVADPKKWLQKTRSYLLLLRCSANYSRLKNPSDPRCFRYKD